MAKLEDIFSGTLELTATELAYLRHALSELYMRGGWAPKGEDRRDLTKRVNEKIGMLKLTRMVTPDGSHLVSVEEHEAIVAGLNRDGSEQVWVVDKAHIVASFAIAWNGVGLYEDARAVVERIRVPSYIETDERGVLRAVWR